MVGLHDHVDDPIVGQLRLLVFATDDPAIRITHGISDGRGVLAIPPSGPGAPSTPVTTLVPGGDELRAVFLGGARLEFVDSDHNLHAMSATLEVAALPGAARVTGAAALKDRDYFDDPYQAWLFYVVLELPRDRFQVVEHAVGQQVAGLPPEQAAVGFGGPAARPAAIALRGFAAEFVGTDHFVRTLSFGVTTGWAAPGDPLAAFAGVSHQDHWREPYQGAVYTTAITGAVDRLDRFEPHRPTLLSPRLEAMPRLPVLPRRRRP